MILLQVNNICKAYGAQPILENVSLLLQSGDRVGVVGANGAGKTTLFRCITGTEQPDSGDISLSDTVRLGYLQQNTDWSAAGTIWDELVDSYRDVISIKQQMERLAEQMTDPEIGSDKLEPLMKEYGMLADRFERMDGYNIETNARKVARGLGFNEADEQRRVETLSGGEKTRLSLAKLLLRQPDLLLLDEPTNHLDIEMVEWLETFLSEYSGGIIVISHDRYFLDKVTNKTLLIENRTGQLYPANYSRFLILQEEQRESAQRAYDKQQKWIEKTEAFIDRYRAGIKSKQARGRQSQLSRVERFNRPEDAQTLGEIAFEPLERSGDKVLDLVDIQVGFEARSVLCGVRGSIRRCDGVALVGPNGAGKTTLLKVITGQLKPSSGQCRIGSKVKIGYFSQHHENLTLTNTLLAEMMHEFGFTEAVSRKYLAMFLFQGDDVYKLIVDLSGGERARIVLLKLLLSGANFLIMDEPTNHLDIPSKEAVEQALQEYAGTFLVVSHDRYFLDKVANRIWELNHGLVQEYLGDYTYFQNKKREMAIAASQATVTQSNTKEVKSRKEKQKVNYTKLIAQIEREIGLIELELKEVTELLGREDVHEDVENLKSLTQRYDDLNRTLSEKMSQWEEYLVCESEQT